MTLPKDGNGAMGKGHPEGGRRKCGQERGFWLKLGGKKAGCVKYVYAQGRT